MPHRRLDPPRAEPCFDRLRLTNVRCFEETEVPLDPRVTVIIGENGAGKTTVAEALASLSFGEEEGLKVFPFRNDAPYFSAILLQKLDLISGQSSANKDVCREY